MTQLNDFSKITHNGNEIGKVLHQGKTIWRKELGVYLAQDSDFVEVNGHWIYRGARSQVEIPTHINGQLVTSTQYMFSGNSTYAATRVTKVVLEHSNVTNMSYMFYYSSATTLDLSSFNTSNVTDMKNMFFYSSATTLDLSSFNTSNVTNMTYMFFRASVTTLDLSNFNTSKVTNISNMFRDSKAAILDLSSFDTSNVIYTNYTFGGANTTVGYARTQADADRFNATSNKPAGLNFVVNPFHENLALGKLFSTSSSIDSTQLSFLTDGDIKTDTKRMTKTVYNDSHTFTLNFGYEAIVQSIIMYSGERARDGSYTWPRLSATINGEIFNYDGATNLYQKELSITNVKATSANITIQGAYGGVYEIEIWGKKVI